MTNPKRLSARVMIVEDEAMIAMFLEGVLIEAGCEVVGPHSKIESGIEVARDEARIDAALLDVNLGRSMVFPIADELAKRNVPIAFLTGYGTRSIPERFKNCLVVTKPYTAPMVVEALTKILRKPGAVNAA